ncbi:sugar-binding domain-containing protein [Cohnella algarum]|uniref:sugar-binding domain-containing protein n=1 Tax=Cohnella algarum TaxID=2044859 RepID=UPI001F087344|nr:sugar-binding domain-containing protein [Cohnella algarum]
MNGEWQFEFDFSRSGKERGLQASDATLKQKIVVPFCPESKLSGIGHTDFIPAVWYKRSFTLPGGWEGGEVLLHFGAVDYEAEVWINDVPVGKHRGGYGSFSFPIGRALVPGENVVTVYAEDDVRSGLQPRGKQSGTYHSRGCDYTRTTGIWQTVWLEHVPETHLVSFRLVPDPANARLHVTAKVAGLSGDVALRCSAELDGKPAGSETARVGSSSASLSIPLTETRLWQPGAPALYDLKLELLKDGQTVDRPTRISGCAPSGLTG